MSRLRFVGKLSSATVLLVVVLCCGTARADYSDAVLADNPVAYWRLNEVSGDTAVNLVPAGADFDGEYIDGILGVDGPDILADGTPLTGMGADNLAFGTEIEDQYVQVLESPVWDLPKFTMTGWVKSDLPQAGRTGLFGVNDSIEFGLNPGNTVNIWFPNTGAASYALPGDGLVEEAWYHVGVVGTGSEVQIYLNGEQVAVGGSSLPGSAGYGASQFTFNIGGGGIFDGPDHVQDDVNLANQFDGVLDEVAMWDIALTETQVASMWDAANQAGGSFSDAVLATSPLGYWQLNETTGTVAVNSGDAGAVLDGTYYDGVQGVAGPNYPGMDDGNTAYQVGPDGLEYVGVDAKPLNDRTEFSIGGWVKYEDLAYNRIGLFGQNDVVEFGFIDPATVQAWTPAGGSINWTHDVDPEDWVHLVAVGDGEELRLYVNGEEMVIGGSPLPTEPESYGDSDILGPFNIAGGGIWDVSGNQFYGALADVAVFDRALTPLQIQSHFDAAVGSTGLVGDYDSSGALDEPDLNLQAIAIEGGQNPLEFDLTGDGIVDYADRVMWVDDLKNTWIGDANLDDEFNSGDMVQVFARGKYENGETATWGEGDWNADLKFGSGDMVAAFVAGGYEKGKKVAATSAVPEPGSVVLALLGMIGLVGLARRGRR